MSYRNPKQIVDTQSGQYVREMQRSLADTSSKYFASAKKEYERRAKLNAKIVADSQERVNKASNEINQVASANKAINFDQMYDNLDTYNKYMQINPAKRTREMNLFISNMDNSGTNLKNNLANTIAAGEPFMEAREKGLGVPGGIYSAAKGLKKYEVMYGYNQAPGSKKMDYNPLTNEFRVNVIGANGEKLGSSLNQDIEHLDMPQIIPDETENMKALNETVKTRMDLKNPNSPAYADQKHQTPTEVNNTKFLSKLPSRSVYLKYAEGLAKSEIDSMTAGEAIALYNDIIGGGDIIEYQKTWVEGSEESINAKDKITKAYANYVADKFGKDVLMVAGPRIKQTDKPQGTPPLNQGANFYNKIKQNPISFLREFTEIKGTYDKDKNTISVPQKKGEKDLVFNMKDPDSRIDFYTRMLKFSKFAKGDSDSAKLIRSQFSEALRADNSKKFAAKTEQKEFEKFADEWDKNNPAPYNSAFRMQSIMDAYKESKKNFSNEDVEKDVEKVNSITSTTTEKKKIKEELNNIINNSSDPKKIITKISQSDATVARNPLNFANKYLGFDENNEQHQDAIKGFLNGAIPNLVKNKKDVAQDTSAWCAAFVNDVLKQGKFPTLDYGKDNYNLIRAKEYEKIGAKVNGIDSAKEGDIVVTRKRLTNDKGQKYWQYHTGFYSGKKNGEYTMLGGNQNNKVSVRTITKEEVYATRRIKDVEEISESNRNKILNTEFFDKTEKQEVR